MLSVCAEIEDITCHKSFIFFFALSIIYKDCVGFV
jgi:hypothetical protein